MGWHSTMEITAADARKLILSKIPGLSDVQLEDMLDSMLYDKGYNFSVVDAYQPPDERSAPYSYDTDGSGL
jgi:hypothetical protein